MRNVLVIAGPGGLAFGREEVELLTKGIQKDSSRRMLCVGDGVEQISVEKILKKLEEISQDEEPTTVIIEMHGTEKHGQYYFINGKSYISSKELFEAIKSKFANRPVDVFVTSCHGGACLKDKDILPEGSVIVTLSQEKITTAGGDVERFVGALQGNNEELTAYNLLKLYLSTLETRIPPEVAISGEYGTLQLDELLKEYIGKKIDRSKVISLLQETMSLEELETILTKIETSKTERSIYAAEYGKAIMVCLANEFGKELNKENFRPFIKVSERESEEFLIGKTKLKRAPEIEIKDESVNTDDIFIRLMEMLTEETTPIERKNAESWIIAQQRKNAKGEKGTKGENGNGAKGDDEDDEKEVY